MVDFGIEAIQNPKSRIPNRVGAFVYRLGRKILILERGVRFPYALPDRIRKKTARAPVRSFFFRESEEVTGIRRKFQPGFHVRIEEHCDFAAGTDQCT